MYAFVHIALYIDLQFCSGALFAFALYICSVLHAQVDEDAAAQVSLLQTSWNLTSLHTVDKTALHQTSLNLTSGEQ